MKKMVLDLRSKILFGGLILLVPLAVSLFFVFQFGNSQIQTAVLERKGLQATVPLLNAMIEWQNLGVDQPPSEAILKDLDVYTQAMATMAKDLAYNPDAFKAAGHEWVGTADLVALVKAGAQGNFEKFTSIQDKLASELTFLADSSGLVLDPDIDSYYLVLGLYQSLHAILDSATGLRGFARPETTALNPGMRLSMFAQAKELQTAATELQDEVNRSVKAVPASYGPVPGYTEAMQADIDPLVKQASVIQDFSNQSALATVFSPRTMNTRIDTLVPLMKHLLDDGSAALDVMLNHRIAAFTSTLTTAFLVALAGLVIGLVVLLAVVTSIRRRTVLLVGSLGAVAQGDLTKDIPRKLLTSKDELGHLASSVKVLQDDLRSQVESLAAVTQQISIMGATLAANAEESAAAIEEMSATSTQVARFANGQLDQTTVADTLIGSMIDKIVESNDLTQGMATEFFLFSQSMEANRRRINSTAEEARVTGELSEGLNKTGEQGEKSLESLRQSIGGVGNKTQEIQEIVKFILDISDRTNLLSMNAAIEAAHAGHSGRGFAVVADEIRKLAENSSRQAQSIKNLVDGIAEAANLTLSRSDATGQSFKTVRQDIISVRNASLSIAGQMVQQEAEDNKLSEGLQEFTRFYGELSGAMDIQTNQSKSVQTSISQLNDSSREISHSMDEQKIGMQQATEAVIQVRDTTVELGLILEKLTDLMTRFKV